MFKRIAFIFVVIVFSSIASAQVIQPAKLAAKNSTQTIKVGDEIELSIMATVDKGWHLYSIIEAKRFSEDCGPIPLTISFLKHKSYALIGGIRAINPESKHEEVFDCDVLIF